MHTGTAHCDTTAFHDLQQHFAYTCLFTSTERCKFSFRSYYYRHICIQSKIVCIATTVIVVLYDCANTYTISYTSVTTIKHCMNSACIPEHLEAFSQRRAWKIGDSGPKLHRIELKIKVAFSDHE